MRPIFKTWLTICLLMPLAAHATNREQQLPPSFNGFTAKSHSSPTPAFTAATASIEPTAPTRTSHRPAHEKSLSKTAAKTKNKGKTGTVAQMPAKQSSAVLSRAVNVLGTPYRWGGSSPSKGFDCSGLVKYAFRDVNEADLPRTSNAMAAGHGQKVERKDLKPGDLLFFTIKSSKVNHVAIYLGNDRFIHAPRRGKAVSIDTLKKPYWDDHYVLAKRVLPKNDPVLRISQR
jgi:murein DD-endopeptidase